MMEQKIRDFFEGEVMPAECVQRIDDAITERTKVVYRPLWIKAVTIASALVFVVLALLSQENIRVKAQEFYVFVVNSLSPDTAPVGKVADDVSVSFRGVAHSESESVSKEEMEQFLLFVRLFLNAFLI